MRQRFFLIMIIFLLPGCVPLVQEKLSHYVCPSCSEECSSCTQETISWLEYEKMDRAGWNARTRTLKREINDCSAKAHCADLHYELAMAYLSDPVPNRKVLDTANRHLKEAAQGGKYKDHALLLNKVLRQLIHQADQNAKLEREVNQLEINLERAKAVDLETISED